MMRFFFALMLTAVSTAVRAECKTELKSTDSYHELSAILKCLNDEIAKLKAVSVGAPVEKRGSIQLPQTLSASGGKFKGTVGSYTIELTSCKRKKKKNTTDFITCRLEYTPAEEGELIFSAGNIECFDNTGERLSSPDIIITNKTISYCSTGGQCWKQGLVAGVAYQTDIEFLSVSPDVKYVALLRLKLADETEKWVTLAFRNIPISN